MPTLRFDQFVSNSQRAKELIGLGEALSGLTVGRVDAADMYRAAIVQGVAALDSYVHDIVLDLAVRILLGTRPAGSATRVGLHFGAISELISAGNATELEMRSRLLINERLNTETFQKPDDIAKAFAMVGVNRIWSAAFGNAAESTKRALSVVVRRRNMIVHRCDVDPADLKLLLPLSSDDARSGIESIENVVNGFEAVLC
ncbi:hypothetical protein [Nocardia cerradoensis]|uniref:hypothetical protein n=1 Tax=Nocardia cerradoensis TaxID=85688 RepID=UPI00117FC7C1|nr:hypothetical protein [Nocardia cerradoensis]NKY46057.1 hypothetical protein [Nocardia cerradoensis]